MKLKCAMCILLLNVISADIEHMNSNNEYIDTQESYYERFLDQDSRRQVESEALEENRLDATKQATNSIHAAVAYAQEKDKALLEESNGIHDFIAERKRKLFSALSRKRGKMFPQKED